MFAIFKFLRKLRDLGLSIPGYLDLFSLPDVNDKAACLIWCEKIVDAGEKLADLTATDIDDQMVAAFGKIVDSPEAFAAFHALLVTFVTSEVDGTDDMIVRCQDAKVIGDIVGVPVSMILMIVMAIVRILIALRSDK